MLAMFFISRRSIYYFQKNPTSKLNPSLFFPYFNDRRLSVQSSSNHNQKNNDNTTKPTTNKSKNKTNIFPKKIPQTTSPSSSQLQSNSILMKKEFNEAVTFRQLLDVFHKYQTELLEEEKKKKPFEMINFSSKLHRDQIVELSKDELSQLEYYLGLYHRFLPESVKIAFFQGAMNCLTKDEIVKSAEDLSERIFKLLKTRKDLKYSLTNNEKDQLIRLLQQATLWTSSFSDYCDFIDLVIRSLTGSGWYRVHDAMQLILPHLIKFENSIERVSMQELSRFVDLLHHFCKFSDLDAPCKAVYLKLLFRVLEGYYNPNHTLMHPKGMIHCILRKLNQFNIKKQSLSLQQIDCIWTGIKLDSQKLKGKRFRLKIAAILGLMGFQYPDDFRKDIWDIIAVQLSEELIRGKYPFSNVSGMLVSFHRVNYVWKDMPKELKKNIFILLNHLTNQIDTMRILDLAMFMKSTGAFNSMANPGITWEMIPDEIKTPLISKSIQIFKKGENEIWQPSEWKTVGAVSNLFANFGYCWNINENMQAIILRQFTAAVDRMPSIDSNESLADLAALLLTFGVDRMKWTPFPQESLDKLWMTIDRDLNKTERKEIQFLLGEIYYSLSLMNTTFYTFQSSHEIVLQRFEGNLRLFGLVLEGLGKKTDWKQLENRKKILQLVHRQLEKRNKDSNFDSDFDYDSDFMVSKIITGLTLMTFDFFLDGPLTTEDKEEFIQIHRPIVQIIFSECHRVSNQISDFYHLPRAIAEYLDWFRTVPRSLREPLLQAAGQKEIPEMIVSKEIQTTWRKEIVSFGEDLLSYLRKEGAAAGVTGYDSNKSISFEVIPHYQGLPSGKLSMPLAVKFNHKVLAFIIFVENVPYPSGEILPSRDTSLVEYVYGYYYQEVGVFRVESETILTPEYREDQIKVISDELFNFKRKMILTER